MEKYKLYVITCLVNGKKYIGKTCKSLDCRFQEHIRDCKRNVNRKLQNAIKKYGKQNFTISLLEECDTEEESYNREIQLIAEHNTYKNGYNSSTGGDGFTSNFMKEVWQREEYKSLKKSQIKQKWENNDYKERVSKKITEASKNNKEVRSQIAKKQWECLNETEKTDLLKNLQSGFNEWANKNKHKFSEFAKKNWEINRELLLSKFKKSDLQKYNISNSLVDYYKQNPNAKNEMKNKMLKRYENEEYRKNHIEKHNTPEYLEKLKERSKNQWKNPKTRLKSFWNRDSEKFRNAWNDVGPCGAD